MSDTIRNILFRAARAECAALNAVAVGYNKCGLDSGDMEHATSKAFSIFKEREMPDVAVAEYSLNEWEVVYGDLYLSNLADRALSALRALEVIIDNTDHGGLYDGEFNEIRALLEELAPEAVEIVTIPVQATLAFPDAVK
jgi:hypothetical protein